ncbi:MAG: NlpC/P60 family protein [Hamadaea sp.]|uniref:C40 family peptidase n=1 Tax=Hamadaea sp. TaxID=2024425 RepID=UPI0018586477|nr:NlpC/P60 family protein [Hamadaea sp.]NUR72045.1 NlpC/P60 family protein [Hamadaea sp.]NUT17595.1 NlpC/P60 family protein [Hamadaea sp.]
MTRRRVGAARLSALLTAAIVTSAATPAVADPVTTTAAAQKVPDGGLQPVPNGPLQLPFGVPATGSGVSSDLAALAAQLDAIRTEVSILAERRHELLQAVTSTATETVYAQYEFAEAENRLAKAKKALADAASDAYVESGGLPDFGLGGLAPRADDPVHGSSGAAHELALAKAEYERTKTAYETAQKNEADTKQRYASVETTFNQRVTAKAELETRNASKVAEILRQEEAAEQARGRQYLNNDALAGYKANPKALAAVNFALKQLGKSYVWGAEGPDHYDCSGLMWAAYRTTGYSLPRVSRDQYQGTKDTSVSRYALLPGDLLFFGEDPANPASIHHVGMYLGNGKMIHSPTTGDVVKISNVWWSHFFGATRVYQAIKVPTASPTPTRSSTSPSPTRSSTSPSPTQTTSSPSPSPTTNSPTPAATTDSPAPADTDTPSTNSPAAVEPTPTPTP